MSQHTEFSIDVIATNAYIGYNIQFIVVGPYSYIYDKDEAQPQYCMYEGNTDTIRYGKVLSTLGTYNVFVIPNQHTDRKTTIAFQIIHC
jgi:hypothetical protein